VVAEKVRVEDPDQVAGLLAAIEAFAHEAFEPEQSARLSRFQVGDLSVWVDRDARLTVAAVVRGAAPEGFRQVLRTARERVALAYQEDVTPFHSDVTLFARDRPELERCLLAQRREPPRRAQIWLGVIGLALMLGLAALLDLHYAHRAAQARLLATYRSALEEQPGFSITSVARRRGKTQIVGLRDPLADDPALLLARRGLAPAELHFSRFISLDPTIAERRARHILAPPPGVTVAMEAGQLHAAGIAPKSWIDRARLLAPALPGVEGFYDRELAAEEDVSALRSASEALEAIEVPFAPMEREPSSQGAVARASAALRQVLAHTADARRSVCVTVAGHAVGERDSHAVSLLSRLRADNVVRALVARGVPPDRLVPVAAGLRAEQPADAGARRNATFRVQIGDPDAPCGGPR
jgi:OOP family OmpA-OmpF porin